MPRSRIETARLLSDYLHGKQIFFRRFVQMPGGAPGLTRFRRYFDRLKTAGQPRIPGRSSGTHVIRKQFDRWRRLTRQALESPVVDGIEIRISPFQRPIDYQYFFELWEKDLRGRGRNGSALMYPARRRTKLSGRHDAWYQGQSGEVPPTSFVVHFTRWRPAGYAPSRNPLARGTILFDIEHGFDSQLRRIDYETAMLQRFRALRPDLARWIVGIDVANLERHNGVELYAPYLTMLSNNLSTARADRLLSQIQQSPYCTHWQRLMKKDLWPGPSDLPALGMTYHAGEDYQHPAEGLHAIASVLDLCRMREGDRIGHGLALGAALPGPEDGGVAHAIMSQGSALETLIWLRSAFAATTGVSPQAIFKIEREIADLAAAVFGRLPDSTDVWQLVRLWASRDNFRLVDRDHIGELFHNDPKLVELYHFWHGEGGRQARFKLAELPSCLFEAPEVVSGIDLVRRDLISRLVRDRIVLEINPSSNVAVGETSKFAQHPVFSILEHDNAIRISINCDDPGTFSTRLESEYAAIQDAINDIMKGDPSRRDQLYRVIETTAEASERTAFAFRHSR